jgi:hypothetical protein
VISASPIPQGAIRAIGRISIFGTNGASALPRPRGGTFSFRFDFLRVRNTEEGGLTYLLFNSPNQGRPSLAGLCWYRSRAGAPVP